MVRREGILCTLAVALVGAHASAVPFTFTVENVGVQPLTPVFVATHNGVFDIFDAGAPASPEVVAIAEQGDTAPMEALAMASADVADYEVGSLIMPGDSTTVTIDADLAHPYLSFASMLPVTNDAFIGAAQGDGALPLFRFGEPQEYEFTLSWVHVWDAGSELNTELAADVPFLGGTGSPDEGGVIFAPHEGISGTEDVGSEYDFFGMDVARIIIVPESATLWILAAGGLVFSLERRRRLA